MDGTHNLLEAAIRYVGRLAEDIRPKAFLIAFGTLWASIPAIYLFAIGWLLLDLATGLAKAYAIGPNRSQAGKDGALKAAIYLGLLALADYASHSWTLVAAAIVPIPGIGEPLGGLLLLLAKGLPYIASGLITHTEMTSILENVLAIARHKGWRWGAVELFARVARVRGEAFISSLESTIPSAPVVPEKKEDIDHA